MVYDTFTAANTEAGFKSYFEEIIRDRSLSRVYLIKGGPGCGKSTFMKKIAARFDGETVERMLCSSDPDSLDGVYLRDRRIVIIDATAPHAYDMSVPGAFESLIDLSQFWDEGKLAAHREEIASLFSRISGGYKTVYALLRAAGAADAAQVSLFDGRIDRTKLERYAVKLAAMCGGHGEGKTERRLLAAFGGNGTVTLDGTAEMLCDRFIAVDDGANVSDGLLRRTAELLSGSDMTLILSPLCPERRIEGIILKDSRLGIFAAGHPCSVGLPPEKVIKRINARTLTDRGRYAEVKNKLAFSKKLIRELIERTAAEMGEIKILHDGLEKYYVDAADHDALNGYTEEFIGKIKRSG